MDLPRLITDLSDPRAYPHPVDAVAVRQTHISVVFLAGPFAYKVKKPVDLGFLDFRTLDRRRHFCDEEVRLNRRLAPAVYLGIVPIVRDGDRLTVDGRGTAVEWAVKMVRLPDDATLEHRLERGEVDAQRLAALARVVAGFHAAAESSERVWRMGRVEVVAGNARENFAQAGPEVGRTVHPGVFARLRDLTESELVRLGPRIEARAARGVPRDTHGDLHLDHVYLFPDRPPPDDLVAIDCIEFNERFRFADPVADVAFLVMDLKFHGRPDLAAAFADAYFAAADDAEGRALLPFYTAYRAAVRGKVEGFELREPEIPDEEKAAALLRARAHWLLALAELEEPARRPALVLIGGLPGTGKSTLARGLADAAGFTVIRSDVVRKELAGLSAEAPRPDAFETGLYDLEATARTYAESLRRAEEMLFAGGRVIVDASFRDDSQRARFLAAARRLGVPGLWLECQSDADESRRRLAARRGDVSDADWEVYRQAAGRWEAPGDVTRPLLRVIDTGPPPATVRAAALGVLRGGGLA